jgi:hypothetical protein
MRNGSFPNLLPQKERSLPLFAAPSNALGKAGQHFMLPDATNPGQHILSGKQRGELTG